MLNLGDIFISGKEVLMVINAQCDLAGQRRKYNASYSILFIPGKLIPIEDKLLKQDKAKPITQIILDEDNKYRILWDTKRVFSCEYGKIFVQIKQDMNYSRKYRLRLPYSLEVQQAFTLNISRVGIPVMPPVDIPVLAKVYYNNGSGNNICLEEDNGVYITSKKINPIDDKDPDPKYLRFTGGFIDLLIDGLIKLVARFTDEAKGLSTGKQLTNLTEYIKKLETLLTDNEFMKLTMPTKLKSGSNFNGTSVKIFVNIEPTNFESICIHITTLDADAE